MTPRYVLIARPQAQAISTCNRLALDGIQALPLPTIAIVQNKTAATRLQAYCEANLPDAVLVTSQHALPLLQTVSALHAVPLLVPGMATAEEAKQLGFSQILIGEGNAASLLGLLKEQSMHRVLYARGETVALPLAEMLRQQGVDCTECVVYHSETASHLPETVQVAFASNGVDAIVFYSQLLAQNTEALLSQYGLIAKCANIQAVAVSARVAEALSANAWAAVHIAAGADYPAIRHALQTIKSLDAKA